VRYKAKVDGWIAAFFLAAIVLPWFTRAQWASVAILAVLVIFGCPQWYELKDHGLLIRAGLTRRTIPYDKIRAAGPVDEGRSGIALSMDRVKIVYDFSSEMLIAPVDRAAFLLDIAARCPQLSWRGSDLIARVT
jgi:hypothetical protein